MTRKTKLLFTMLLLAASNLFAEVKKPVVARVSQADLSAFLSTYCIDCHGPEKEKGDVRFDTMSFNITHSDEAQLWQDVLDALNGGDMPPRKAKQPMGEELTGVLGSLTKTLQQARERLNSSGGEVVMRRLNRREYAATIRELFGVNISINDVPEDEEPSHFDTAGKEQFFTSTHFDRYLKLNTKIVNHAFRLAQSHRGEPRKNRQDHGKQQAARIRKDVTDKFKKLEMKKQGKTWQEMGFKDAGDAQILFDQFFDRAIEPKHYLAYPKVDEGVYLVEFPAVRYATHHQRTDPRGFYKVRIRAGVNGDVPEIRRYMSVTNDQGIQLALKVNGTVDDPHIHEFAVQTTLFHPRLSFKVRENRTTERVHRSYIKRVDQRIPRKPHTLIDHNLWAALWVDWIEIEGPFYDTNQLKPGTLVAGTMGDWGPIIVNKTSFFENLIFPEGYQRHEARKFLNDRRARELLEKFALRAFRNHAPPTAYIDQLMMHFESARKTGHSFDASMSAAMGIILSSPSFLFIKEQVKHPQLASTDATSAESANSRRLNAQSLASRLSYFLWSCPPDDTLLDTAQSGDLHKPEVLKVQVERMLNDPRSSQFISGFMSQWAQLKRFQAITVDEKDYPHFNPGLKHSAFKEVQAFFQTLVKENLPAANLIDSDFVMVDPLLAQHYGIKLSPEAQIKGSFQKIKLPADSPRGGLLGQAAILTLGSNGERSSPVIRGAWVMEKLLHDPPAPPPPNVPELGNNSRKPMTGRQMVELHQSRAQCASCHRKMDAIGFGLENFDTVGSWRSSEKLGRKQVPIDTHSVLPGGGEFNDIHELKALLIQQQEAAAQSLLEGMMSYAIGRNMEFSDSQQIINLMAVLKTKKYRVRDMIHAIVQSDLFKTK